jgi:hypothetical protein
MICPLFIHSSIACGDFLSELGLEVLMETAPGEQKRLWVKGVGAEGSGSCETRENGVHSGSPTQFSGNLPPEQAV